MLLILLLLSYLTKFFIIKDDVTKKNLKQQKTTFIN